MGIGRGGECDEENQKEAWHQLSKEKKKSIWATKDVSFEARGDSLKKFGNR